MVTNHALYHQACHLKYNNTLQRAEKRSFMAEGEINDAPGACKRTRFHSRSSSTEKAQEAQCFFCREPAGTDGVHDVATFQMDSKVRDWATILEDKELLGRLSAGDMVAQDAKYHNKCISVLQKRVRKYKAKEREVSGIVFAELVLYIEEARLDEDTTQVFKLANLVELYQSRMQQLGVELETKGDSLPSFLTCAHTQREQTSGWYFGKTSGLLSPKPVSWRVIMMWSILHVLHRPCAAICLKKVSPLTDSLKGSKKIMCHHCYLPW